MGTFDYGYPCLYPHEIAGLRCWNPLDALADMLTRTPATRGNPTRSMRCPALVHFLLSSSLLLAALCPPYISAPSIHISETLRLRACLSRRRGLELCTRTSTSTASRAIEINSLPCCSVPFPYGHLIYPHVAVLSDNNPQQSKPVASESIISENHGQF